jgi:RND family efflux transporter MFP subunit
MSNEQTPAGQGPPQGEQHGQQHAEKHGHDGINAPEQKPIRPLVAILGAALILIAAAALAGIGIVSRMHAATALNTTTQQTAAPTVIALPPKQGAPVDSFVLPGNVSAWSDSPIYARTNGYLTHWYYDIGARVKKGALLAEIASPEVDQQLLQAVADLNTAETNANNAHVQADRYTGLVKNDAVSKLDTDNFVTQAASASSAVRSAQANVQRLKELQGFEKIYAPFDGVVTARNVDTGQLIDLGASQELFHLQALQTLRVYANVPQVYSQTVKRGEKIDVSFVEQPGKTYQGTLVRTTDAVDPVSRTLLVEIDLDNRAGELMPGTLAQVHFKTPPAGPTFVIPASATIFRASGLQVGTVDQNSIAHLVTITISQDDGASVQVITGLKADDRVIQNPPDSLIEGERVTIVQSDASQAGPAAATPQAGAPQNDAPEKSKQPGGKQ